MDTYSVEVVNERYKKLRENAAVLHISSWVEPNTAEPTDETKILERAKGNIDVFFNKMDEIAASFNKKANIGA